METERITALQNPLIRHIRKLQSSRSYRYACGEFVCDGWKLLEEARKWFPNILTVVYTQGMTCPELPSPVRVVEVPESLMQSLSSMKSPQGVVFTCALPPQREVSPVAGALLLDCIQDPGNLGTILRTADAFQIPVYLTNGCADPYSEKTLRASMGAVLRSAPMQISMEDCLRLCRQKNIPIAATALTEKAVDLRTLDLRQHLTVIGSEGQGICEELLRCSQQQVIIPMDARCESLNAAVAATIVMWQMKAN